MRVNGLLRCVSVVNRLHFMLNVVQIFIETNERLITEIILIITESACLFLIYV
jgi:hypothetical protein